MGKNHASQYANFGSLQYILGININTNHPDNQEQAMTDILDLYCTFVSIR